MKFDNIDSEIFNVLVENETLTSTDIAKMLFEPQDRDELIAKNTLISYRLKKWVKSGLIIYSVIEKANHYSLNKKAITIGDSFLKVDGVEVSMGYALVINMEKNGYIVKFLDAE